MGFRFSLKKLGMTRIMHRLRVISLLETKYYQDKLELTRILHSENLSKNLFTGASA